MSPFFYLIQRKSCRQPLLLCYIRPMEPQKPHILAVDDDKRLRDLIAKYLTEQGFRVSSAANAAEARQQLTAFRFDLIVLDIMMPGESGLELTKSLRQENAIPILLLTAKGEAGDRIDGLEKGADDYLPKPFEPRELVLRIQSILKRARKEEEEDRYLRFGLYMFDRKNQALFQDGKALPLTRGELAVLAQLAARPGQVMTRDDFGETVSSRMLDMQIGRLRRKIEPDPHQPSIIQTVRGQGYRLQVRE